MAGQGPPPGGTPMNQFPQYNPQFTTSATPALMQTPATAQRTPATSYGSMAQFGGYGPGGAAPSPVPFNLGVADSAKKPVGAPGGTPAMAAGRGTPAAGRGTAAQQQMQAGRGRGGRGGPAPSPGHPMAAHGNTPQHARTSEFMPASKRRRTRADKDGIQLMAKLAETIPESAVYGKLLELERRIDGAVERRKWNVRDALLPGEKLTRTMRLYVYNTVQAAHHPDDAPGWTLHILGRILEANGTPVGRAPTQIATTEYLQKVVVEFDREQFPGDNGRVEWVRTSAADHADQIEIKRRGSVDCSARISVTIAHLGERVAYSPQLAQVLGAEHGSRSDAIHGVWAYCRLHNLIDGADSTDIKCPEILQRLFTTGTQQPQPGPNGAVPPVSAAVAATAPPIDSKIKFSTVAQRLVYHFRPYPELVIDYVVKVGGPSPTSAECYDLKVDVARALNAPNRPTVSLHAQQLFEKAVKGPDVGAADEAIRQAIRRIEEHKRRRAFFLAFSTSPAEFVNRVIASQARDLEIVTGPGVRAREAERRTEFYKQPWVEDAIMRYLQRATQAGAS